MLIAWATGGSACCQASDTVVRAHAPCIWIYIARSSGRGMDLDVRESSEMNMEGARNCATQCG